MVRGNWVVFSIDEDPICDFGNTSSHEAVEVEWDRTIRNSFISEQIFFWVVSTSFRSWRTLTRSFQDERHSVQGDWVIHILGRITSRSRQTRPQVQHAENIEDGMGTDFKEWWLKTDRDRLICTILLFKDCFDNTIYRWLKELGNISPKNSKIRHIQI